MVVKFPIRDSQGVAKVGGVCLDVTESRKTQTALAEREMLLRKLGDNLPGGAIYQFLLHPDGRVEFPYVSAGIEDVLGITAEEIMAQPELVYGMIESDDLEAHNQAQAISLAQLSTFDHEFRCRRPDGEVVWIHCRSAPRRLANGAAIWEGVFIDTTEAHRIQDELRRSEEHYRFLTESIPQLVWIYDAEGRPSYFNRRWYEYTGQTVEQSMSDRWHESLHPDDVALAITTWNSVKNVGSDYRVEYRLRRHDGVYRWHLSQAWPLITADGRINGWFGTCTDVHAARTVQEELTRSLHQREVLLREVHHRVKNNLQVIISLLHLQSVRVHEKAALEALRDSQHRVRAMALVHEHLYRTGDLSHIPMANYIRGLAEALARSFNVPQIQVAMEIEPFDLTIDQAVPCGLILAELITNAYKHAFPSGQSGQIRITATRAPGCDPILLRVADNGIGLRPEPTGRPLGLTIVQDLTRQLRGTVALHHDGGLQVEIRFPCSLAFSEA
jgi:PAS domain S-box-containing protein